MDSTASGAGPAGAYRPGFLFSSLLLLVLQASKALTDLSFLLPFATRSLEKQTAVVQATVRDVKATLDASKQRPEQRMLVPGDV